MFVEWDKYSFTKTDGSYSLSEFTRVESSFTITDEEKNTLSSEQIGERFQKAGNHIKEQTDQKIIQEISQVAQESGNVIDLSSINPFYELDMLEKLPMSFNGFSIDRPIKHISVLDPATSDKLEAMRLAMTEEEKKQYDDRYRDIIKRKHDAFMEDVKSRKLSDE